MTKEPHLIEVKQAWRDEYLKWIYGFANARGGLLYIGKRDDGTVCGVANAKKLLEDLPNKVRDTLGLIVYAVRKVIFNALIHQDFSADIPVQISVYENKLYISNDCVFPEDWTGENIMQKHRSLPHNPDIANTFFRIGFIESWWRGIEKICSLCKKHRIPEPEYTIPRNDIMMMFKAGEHVNGDLLGTFPSKLSSNLEITYKAICEDTYVSNYDLAIRTNHR